jgi:outer membrane protein OmpA-like peptidoglycan-associated protein
MKCVFLWITCGVLFIHGTIFAQQNEEYAHWSAALKLGANRAEYVGGISIKGMGFTFGVELERTFNPLWGLAVAYDYLGYSYADVNGSAHEFTGLAALNIANLVEKHRKGNWQKLNVYGRLGAGFSLFSATNSGKTIVIPMGASVEYNITPKLAISLNGDRRWHMSSTMGFTRAIQDRPVYWAGTVGLRFKFGNSPRPHIRNTRLTDYEAPYTQVVYYAAPLHDEVAPAPAPEVVPVEPEVVEVEEAPAEEVEIRIEQVEPAVEPTPDISDALRFENVEYDLGGYEISDAFQHNLNELAELLKNNPSVKIEILGYTDDSGQEVFNKALSLKRADIVKNYLVRQGVDATRITTTGMADANPIAPNTTLEGRQKNRRVEVVFLPNE